ncbi:CBU_0592 family membrane protein [Halarcobacter sp.]|uniref:CBU_0592 family membrane protein n=1 Tax=Halarcobacter sp. TaxID=2321133 RepID=UPI0029F4745F|nr:hypothetical protein [Halarcobacter sp.]
MDIFQLIGFIGMVFVVVAYFLLQTEKKKITSWTYQVLNLIGAILLLISLFVHFNLGSFVIEIFWIIITILGMYKNLKGDRK